MSLPAVACFPPPLGAPVNRFGPAGGLDRRPMPPGVPDLPRNIPARARCPGTRCPRRYWRHWAWVTPPPQHRRIATGRAPPCGLGPRTRSGTRIATLRRVPIAAFCTCVRALNCLLQSLERDQTFDTLTPLLIFPRIALAAPARGGKLTPSSSTQKMPAQLPSGSHEPLGGTDRLHPQVGEDRWLPDTSPKQGRGTGDGCCLAPSLSPHCCGRPRPPRRRCAIQLLTSYGVCDAADPAALTRQW